ncbi:MAG TPA: hypothetical protein VIY68_11640 [Steroidobacteraceae bacterium]
MTESKRIRVTSEVAAQSQAAELNAVWAEIVAGQLIRLNIAADDLNEITERARTDPHVITNAVETNPGTGQSRRLVRFLAGVYNGSDFPFDLTNLRAVDTDLASACIDYRALQLRYLVRLYVKELVLKNFAGLPADQLLERMIELSLYAEEKLKSG